MKYKYTFMYMYKQDLQEWYICVCAVINTKTSGKTLQATPGEARDCARAIALAPVERA